MSAPAPKLRPVPDALPDVPVTKKRRRIPFINLKVKALHLSRLCDKWSKLSDIGKSPHQCLDKLADGFEGDSYPIASALDDVHGKVLKGRTLAEAFGPHEKVFGREFIQCIQIGEETGKLPIMLRRLAKHYRTEHKAAQGMKKLLIYPSVLLCVAAFTCWVIIFKVVPGFILLMSSFKGFELPWPTLALIAAYDWGSSWVGITVGLVLLGAIIAAVLTYAISQSVRFRVAEIALKVPVVGPLILFRNIARGFDNMGLLVAAGITHDHALERAAESVFNLKIRAAFKAAREQVLRGRATSTSLIETGVFPFDAVLALEVCEETGDYGEPLSTLAEGYLEDIEHARERLMKMIENATILVFGGLIGFIVIAFYWPMFSIFEHVN